MGIDVKEKLEKYLIDKMGSNERRIFSYLDFDNYIIFKDHKKLSSDELSMLAELVGSVGFGVEPDINFVGIKAEATDPFVVFKTDYISGKLSQGYKYAALLIKIAALVASYDGIVDEKERIELKDYLNSKINLPTHEKQRLFACAELSYLNNDDKKLLLHRLKELPGSKKKEVLNLIKTMIISDGIINKTEVNFLRNVYKLFEIEAKYLKKELENFAADNNKKLDKKSASMGVDEIIYNDIDIEEGESIIDDLLSDFL